MSSLYKALRCPSPASHGTWAVLDFDGARRPVEPYLSSLGGGELGTGVIASPPFPVSLDTITFTVCGHDGQGGGREQNFVALVDAASNETLKRTFAQLSAKEKNLVRNGMKAIKLLCKCLKKQI